MLLSETLFFQGQPIGKVCENSNTGQVTFVPAISANNLAKRKWTTVSGCKKVVLKIYQQENSHG